MTKIMKNAGRRLAARIAPALFPALAVALAAGPAEAYVGPGLGLGIIGTIIGVIAAIVLTLFGLVWYPLKRMFSRKAPNGEQTERSGDGNLQDAEKDPAE